MDAPYADAELDGGIAARRVPGVNGLDMAVLEAGAGGDRPLALLLHGFPELAYSWRHVLPALAADGFHAVAPDLRGYGETRGWVGRYDEAPRATGMMNLTRDVLALVDALGRREVACVVGHDFGSPLAAWCALIRPDVFRAVVMMSAPFAGPPGWRDDDGFARAVDGLGRLDPPRVHYQVYYTTAGADAAMRRAPQGVHAFLRAYYHMKSGDWPQNQPRRLGDATAEALAAMPRYYIMDAGVDMAATVAPHAPDADADADAAAACAWLPDAALGVYARRYDAGGFQGGLNWYRAALDPALNAELRLFAGRRIEVPATFIAGARDWGVYQKPGDFEAMQSRACAAFAPPTLIDGAGHWAQQEKPAETNAALRAFLHAFARP